jgi:hypothetical protein
MSSGSKKIVVVGIVSNAIVTVLKFISALVASNPFVDGYAQPALFVVWIDS